MAGVDPKSDRRWQVVRAALERWNSRKGQRERNVAAVNTLGVGAADSPQRNERMLAREAIFATARRMRDANLLPKALERRMGPTLDWAELPPSEAARRAGRPVARIIDRIGGDTEPVGFGTGFLVGPQLLLTNNHVLATRTDAAGRGANFLYEVGDNGVMRGLQFELDPKVFFLTEAKLDYTIVGVKSRSIEGGSITDLGNVALIEATPKIRIGEPVHIIQHPEGKPKRYAYRENRLLDILDQGFLHYLTDTLEGSSGSPGFSKNWELVCLHHASIPQTDEQDHILNTKGRRWSPEEGDDAVMWIANEGVRVSAIVKSLQGKTSELDTVEQVNLLRELLRSTADPADELVNLPEAQISVLQRRGLSQNALSSSGTNPMANVFNFSGPVTIHVYSALPTVASPAPAREIVAEEKKLRFDPDYDHRPGFDESFLGDGEKHLRVPMPTVSDERMSEMQTDADGTVLVLPYHHYSLAMNKARRLQMWSAVNVNYAKEVKFKGDRKSFGNDTWVVDPRVPDSIQITDPEFYKPAGNIDRGHIVRREDSCWGVDPDEIEFSNSDTFHWTNCTPQHEAFNQSTPGRNDSAYRGMKGLWGDFENHVQQELMFDDDKACILAGPVLDEHDPEHDFGAGAIQYPLSFWKVVVVAAPIKKTGNGGKRKLAAYGFVFSQKDVVEKYGIERFSPGRFASFRRSLKAIESVTGVRFDKSLHDGDVL